MSCRRMGMSLRVTDRRNRDGATVACDALAENVWNAGAERAEARVVHIFGHADQVDTAALRRLVASNNRILDAGEAATAGGKPVALEIEIDAAFDLGVVLAACGPWEQLGIGESSARACNAPGSPPRTRPRCSPWRRSSRTIPARSAPVRCDGCPIWPGCRRRAGFPSISSIARLKSLPSGPTRSSATCSCPPPTCSARALPGRRQSLSSGRPSVGPVGRDGPGGEPHRTRPRRLFGPDAAVPAASVELLREACRAHLRARIAEALAPTAD